VGLFVEERKGEDRQETRGEAKTGGSTTQNMMQLVSGLVRANYIRPTIHSALVSFLFNFAAYTESVLLVLIFKVVS
jgi:hypothetical protein